MSTPEEGTTLIPKDDAKTPLMFKKTFNIESLRMWSLINGILFLLTGLIITNNLVEFPVGSGGFHAKETFIYELFHFNHLCNVLDWNPSKTVSAFLIQFHTLPMLLYIVLNYYRMEYEYEKQNVPKWLWSYCRIHSPFSFVFQLYFYVVFVNPPEDMPSFILHYIPYMFWKISLMCIAIEQVAYISYKEIVPFNIPKGLLRLYCWFMVALVITYIAFVWSVIIGNPMFDTTTPLGLLQARVLMYTHDIVVAIVIPTIFSYLVSKNGRDQTLSFYHEAE